MLYSDLGDENKDNMLLSQYLDRPGAYGGCKLHTLVATFPCFEQNMGRRSQRREVPPGR
jgi:hypothetical protein